MTTTTQTVRVNGVRTKITTRNGKVTMKPAAVLEWKLQAAGVAALKLMPEYAATADDVGPGSFCLAGDMNAGRRGMAESMKATATGIAAGDPDLRVYMDGRRLGLIEYKNADGRLSTAQKDRHALLKALGYPVSVIKANTEDECAASTVATVRGWLTAANDNKRIEAVA